MKNLKFYIGCLLMAVGVTDVVRWFMITAKDISFEAMKAEHASIYPSFMQNPIVSTLILFAIFAGAGLLFVKSGNEKRIRIPSFTGAVLCSVLAFWMMFSLM